MEEKMATQSGIIIAKGKDSFKLGQEVAKSAMEKAGVKKVDLPVIFVSSIYDYQGDDNDN